MKKLFILFLLAFGTAAFANNKENNKDNNTNPGTETTPNATAKKDTAKLIVKADDNREKDKVKPSVKANRGINCSSAEGSKFGISVYFAELVNNNNIKLIKMFLKE